MDPISQAENIMDQTYIRYKTIFENTGTATILIEDDMTISMVNSELERISGIGKADIQGKMKFPDLIAEPDRKKVMENHRRRREDPGAVPRNYPCRVLVPNGGVKDCILTVALIQGTRQSVASITDISKQKQLEREIAKISEDERRQMGQILHDDLGSHLAGVEAMSSLLAGRLEKQGHKDAALAGEIRELVNQAIQKTRAMVRGLVPVRLAETGFMAAVAQLCRDVEKAFGITCRVQDNTGGGRLSNTSALTHMYYIIRESIHNAARHGDAGRIDLVFFEEGPELFMEIRDNGIGMPGKGFPGIGMPGKWCSRQRDRNRCGPQRGGADHHAAPGRPHRGRAGHSGKRLRGDYHPVQNRKKIFIVDDHPVFRKGLAQLIDEESDLCVVGEAEGVGEAMDMVADLRPDLAIVDITLKDRSGMDLIEYLRKHHPDLPILVISMHDESLYAERVLRAGALGYITKQEMTADVVSAVRQVLWGKRYLSARMVDAILGKMAAGRAGDEDTPVNLLSNRELEVFQLLGRGFRRGEIANMLNLSVKTIGTHHESIKKKMHIKSAAELMKHAVTWVQARH
jgi:PAS domain S-box-containing protein